MFFPLNYGFASGSLYPTFLGVNLPQTYELQITENNDCMFGHNILHHITFVRMESILSSSDDNVYLEK